MKKSNIFLDYDDTLVDFNAAVLKHVNEWNGTNLTHKDILTYGFLPDTFGPQVRTLWQKHGLYGEVLPFTTSQWFLDTLKTRYNVVITTKSHPKVALEKEYHAKQHFGIREGFIHVEEAKYPHTKSGPLVDDAAHHIEAHILKNNMPGILFNMNNQNGWSKINMQHRLLRIANSHAAVLRLLGF